MRTKLDNAQGKACYALRSRTIEPVFGQVKTVQGGGRFMRRGLRACAAEWKLLCGTHNLLKLCARPRPPATDLHHEPGTALAAFTGPDRLSASSPQLSPWPSRQPARPLRNRLNDVKVGVICAH